MPAVGAQRQQVAVAGDDPLCAACLGKSEELVVVGVGRDAGEGRHLCEIEGVFAQQRDKLVDLVVTVAQAGADARIAQHALQLVKRSLRSDNLQVAGAPEVQDASRRAVAETARGPGCEPESS